MKDQSASGILGTAIDKIRDLVDVSTIVGEPVFSAEGITIIPVSKVTYGFASGGSDFPSKSNAELFGGGGGAGITITPVAFVVINNGNVTIKSVPSADNPADKIISMVPEVVDTVSGLINKGKESKGETVTE
ncbi:MAG: sporulation protein YtfJ [Clostridia bacterium]|nr:sporulation protein YtfJ [Clostridia bacterium]